MDRHSLDELKNRIGVLEYLTNHDWKPCRRASDGQVGGLCPLHTETNPSFWIHTRKNLFYCHGCGRGGDLIRLVELYHGLTFAQALGHLRRHLGSSGLLEDAIAFYRTQMHCWPQAMAYLAQRGIHDPATIEAMQIGYAAGACLRAHLQGLGYESEEMRQYGLINSKGWDTFYRRVVFPSGDNLYGRSIDTSAPHRFLHGGKGGLYHWGPLQQAPEILLVEGLFDVAALWQAGFKNATCGGGTQLNHTQFQQLITGPRSIWIAFDSDVPGRQAAVALAAKLRHAGQTVRRVLLPHPFDPASYFAAGAGAAHFRVLVEESLP
jgi:DNA primase